MNGILKKSQSNTQLRHHPVVLLLCGLLLCLVAVSALADGWFGGDKGSTKALNEITSQTSADGLRRGGIANTRHNLTMSYSAFGGIMDARRNDYFEVCVYCHTPHGANQTTAAPLWNRTVSTRSYSLYNQVTTLGQPMTQPGPNSLTCLSCHDGATAIDSIINMPTQLVGSFRAGYNVDQENEVNFEFLNQWNGNLLNRNALEQSAHVGLNNLGQADDSNQNQGACLTCHDTIGSQTGAPGFAPNFSVFVIGGNFNRDPERLARDGDGAPLLDGNNQVIVQDNGNPRVSSEAGFLGDDHPIGVRYPTEFGPGVDYNEPTVKAAKISFFDLNGNNHADPNEVRLYDTGDGYEVECASCHDPHGVPVNGRSATRGQDSTQLIPSFLRMGEEVSKVSGTSISANAGSKLCLTCHVK